MSSLSLRDQYRAVRAFSEKICEPLLPEDYVIQSMPDVSPTKWHLAHTSWFFETFLLKPHLAGYHSLHPQYDFLFNSYYNTIGERHCRVKRGLLSRPTVEETYAYRAYVDRHMETLLTNANEETARALEPLVTIGLHHEQQHQELMVTDIKHVFFENPLCPVYRPRRDMPRRCPAADGVDRVHGRRARDSAGPGRALPLTTKRRATKSTPRRSRWVRAWSRTVSISSSWPRAAATRGPSSGCRKGGA